MANTPSKNEKSRNYGILVITKFSKRYPIQAILQTQYIAILLSLQPVPFGW
jgi:hypothetical protein